VSSSEEGAGLAGDLQILEVAVTEVSFETERSGCRFSVWEEEEEEIWLFYDWGK